MNGLLRNSGRDLNMDIRERRGHLACSMKETIRYIAACALALIFFTDVISLNYVPSESMEPTILRNHFIVNLRLNYLLGNPVPKHGTIIVFRENAEPNRLLVKRVIGLPGDTITFKQGRVYRNGDELEESYLMEQGVSYSVISEYSVPEGSLFVMGDNREYSNDSRFMEGTFVPVENIYAQELFQIKFFG